MNTSNQAGGPNNKAITLGTNGTILTTSTITAPSLTINGATNPVTINQTGGAALTMTRSSKSISFNANYSAANNHASVELTSGMHLAFYLGGAKRIVFDNSGHILPETDNTLDLGSGSKRWANIYTGDLNLSNEGSTNSVDGTWGSYTIEEGENDLFLHNKRTGKKYKFNLTEV